MDSGGMLFLCTRIMGTFRNTKLHRYIKKIRDIFIIFVRYACRDFFNVHPPKTSNSAMDSSIAKQIKEKPKMATTKALGLILFYILGTSASVLALFGELHEPYKTVASIIMCLFLAVLLGRSFIKMLHEIEALIDKRISNKERKYQLQKQHERDNAS